MRPRAPSRAARIGTTLLTLALAFTVAFGVFAVVSLGVGVARDGRSPLWGGTLPVDASINPDAVRALPDDVRVSRWPDVTLEIRDPTTRQMVLRSLMDLGPLALFIAGLWLVRGIARSVTEGDPFGERNVSRLRRLGGLLIGGALLVELLNAQLRLALFDELPPHRNLDIGVAGFALPGGPLIGGLGAYMLAEVFAHGVRLREDVEGTV